MERFADLTATREPNKLRVMLNAIVRRPVLPIGQPPVLVLLHGLGADEHDLMGLAPELDPSLLIVCIRAPFEYGNGGFAWFEVQWDADGVHVVTEQALASRDLLIDTLKGLPKALGLEPCKLLLGGFSQGAMMSLGVALVEPDLVSGVLLMSGRLLPEFVPEILPEATAELPFCVQHGTSDGVLPVQGSRQIRDFLVESGCDVTYREYPMAHEISRQGLADARDWLSKRLPQA